MAEKVKKQYNNLNAIKIMAAFFVVCIHIRFPGDFGNAVVAVARFAVPFFFMLSGFFSYYENKEVLNAKYKRKIRHLCTIFAGSFLMYLAYDSLTHILNGSLKNYLADKFSFVALAEFIAFNHPRVMEALWFLPALVYATVVFFFFEKKGITKKMYFLIPVLFVAGVVLREILEFAENPPQIMTKAYFYRNWLFVGLPFFMLGHFIRVNEEKLKNKFSDAALVVIMLVATAESVAVELMHTQKSLYIGTFFAVSALFVLCLKKEGSVKTGKLAVYGAEYSLYVYIFHIMVRNVCDKILSISGLAFVGEKLSAVMPVIIFVLALIASAVYVYIKKLIKSKLKREK